MENKNLAQAWGFFVILALIWGSSFILIKRGLAIYSPIEVGSLRILAASIFLLPFSLGQLKELNRRHWPKLLSVGLLGSFFPAFLFALAQTKLSSSVTGVMNGLTPIFVLLTGALFFHQKVSLRNGIGVLIGFGGMAMLVLAGADLSAGQLNYYALFVVLATVFYGLNLNVIKFFLPDLPALTITSLSLLLVGPAAGIVLFGFTDFVDKLNTVEGSAPAAGFIVLLGVMGTAIALILFNKMVKIASPLFAGSVTYAIPVVAVIWGLIDGEVLLPGHLLGMLFILIGVYVANRKTVGS